jgi:TRAP-type C4-dicarboxylate transport system substrate-binding protein
VGFQIHHPADLQGKGNYFLAGDPVGPKVFAAIGGITAKQVTVPEILPNLTNGSIQVLTVPPLAAEQLQWASRVTDINTMTAAFVIGAIIVSTPKLQGLPDNLRNALNARGAEAAERLTRSIRNLDAQAFARLKASKNAYEPSDAEKAEWKDVFAKVRASLRGSVFSPPIFDKVVSLAQ